MNRDKFRNMISGVSAILTTPFTEKGEVSEERLRKHLSFLIDNGFTKGGQIGVSRGEKGVEESGRINNQNILC